MDLSELVHGLPPKSQPRRVAESSRRGEERPQDTGGKRSHQESEKTGQHSIHSWADERQRSSGRRSNGKLPSSGSMSSPSPVREAPTSERVGGSSGESMIMCELCKRTFQTQKQFDQHSVVFHRRAKLPTKPREASFVCPHCGKAFTSPSKRNVHQNATHMRLRPFQCSICSKSFGYKGDLTKHMATHSGIKAHSCYICGAKFARNFYVKRHIETVHERKPSSKS